MVAYEKSMLSQNELQRMLANRRTSGFDNGTHTSGGRRLAEYKLIRAILELDDAQDVCTECASISETDEDWKDPGLCPDCGDSVQLRLHAHAGGGTLRTER